jgi:hypothetical protein
MARAGKPTGRSAGGERAQARTRRLPTAEAMVGNEPPSRARPRSSVPADAVAIPQPRNDWIVVGNRRFPGQPRAIGHRTLDVLPDMPDIRDRLYQPHLRALMSGIFPRVAFPVRDQRELPSCTGHALAHLIDALRFREIGPDRPMQVSARMIYEMAKRNDEWAGSTYEGSSARGAIKGFFRNGVCPKGPDKEETSPEWVLTYERAKAAREVRLGAYYRVVPDISDYHAALNEIGAIYVSAQIHSHWDEPEDGRIKPGGEPRGGHAFVILGYDEAGFWVLNSWGPAWGLGGLAHWQYKDWASSVMDAWVLQLGVRAPDAFGAAPRATPSSTAGLFGFREPHRSDILGHFINVDDGRLVVAGKYGSPVGAEMQETVKRLTTDSANGGKGYHHLVLYAHGGLNALEDEAARIATWKRHDIFGRNTIYNFHLMWGSGFIDEVFGKLSQSAAGRVAGLFTDWLFEAGLGKQIGAYAWRNMKQDALMAFTDVPDYGGGLKGLEPLLKGLDAAGRRPKLHLVGHSAGAIVLGHLLAALPAFKLQNLELQSIHLMAPACTVKFFEEHYGPVLRGRGALPLQDKVYLYNLTEQLEQDDTVSANIPLLPSYSRSLLYLVSRAYEDKENASLAGMQVAAPGLPRSSRLVINYADGSGRTAARSHGGFDNDGATLSTIMSRVLGMAVPLPPAEDELTGY